MKADIARKLLMLNDEHNLTRINGLKQLDQLEADAEIGRYMRMAFEYGKADKDFDGMMFFKEVAWEGCFPVKELSFKSLDEFSQWGREQKGKVE